VVLTASERGASHVAAQTPNQDAVVAKPAVENGVVAAVADGHGHWRHLRSARGSRLAATIGCQVGQELADRLEREKILDPQRADHADEPTMASVITALVSEFAVPAVIDRWREAVLADLADDPFTADEQVQRQPGDDATVAYGSTLLLAIALREWLIMAQIGDGDVVGVRADGSASLPVPTDPLLDGLVTTSLCGRDPSADFRIAVTDTSADPLLAVLLATDGYGNAQVVEEWPNAFSADLAWLLRNRDEQWLASQLPAWAARCASSDGSADDTTVALLISPAGQSELPPAPRGALTTPAALHLDAASEETTIPAVLRGDTVPGDQVPPERHPIEPVTMRHYMTDPWPADEAPSEALSAGTALPEPFRRDTVRSETFTADTVRADIEPRERTTLRWKPTLRRKQAEQARAETDQPDSSAGADA
jgi:serine/threonine protein phosphatase PrpC